MRAKARDYCVIQRGDGPAEYVQCAQCGGYFDIARHTVHVWDVKYHTPQRVFTVNSKVGKEVDRELMTACEDCNAPFTRFFAEAASLKYLGKVEPKEQ